MENTSLKVKNLIKYFHDPTTFQVLKGVSLDVNKGEFLSIVGKSGSGKSTLLYVLSTMDTDYEGTLEINGNILTGKSQNELSTFRNEHIGFVFNSTTCYPSHMPSEYYDPGIKIRKIFP